MTEPSPQHRLPTIMANWKMAMTIDESRTFIDDFLPEIDDLIGKIQIIICSPATAITTLAPIIEPLPLVEVGAQNSSAHPDLNHTGELSAGLLADAGAAWCMVGHWDVIRQVDKSDEDLNHELHALIATHIRPIILVGESNDEQDSNSNSESAYDHLKQRMKVILSGIQPADMARAVMIYEPEWAIGSSVTAAPELVGKRCQFIRQWLRQRFDDRTAQIVPILYGGSVFPENSEALLAGSDLDGFGAGRRGRNPKEFAQIARTITHAKGIS
ncbi:MAG: triose-phosphate isomerase [Akkermansiaceae bacterium]|jgi:triosephosphate isomerase